MFIAEIVPNSDIMPVFLQKYSRTSPQWLPWEQSEMTAGERWRLWGGGRVRSVIRHPFCVGMCNFFYLVSSLFIENKLIVVVTCKYTTRLKYINTTKNNRNRELRAVY